MSKRDDKLFALRARTVSAMNLRRGLLRLGIGSATVWIVFWTCAYEIGPYTSHNPEPASLAISIAAWSVLAPCLIAAVVLGGWAAAGFRPNYLGRYPS
jgi:hypothetical protein